MEEKAKKITFPFRVVKRENLTRGQNILFTFSAIGGAIIAGAVFLALLGYNPFIFYSHVISGNFVNSIYLSIFVRGIIPLLITSLGVAAAFKMRFWNIGAEGQFIMGSVCGFTVAVLIKDGLPHPLGTIFVIICGALGGGIFGAFTAVLKVRFKTNETLLTLMLNYVALYLVSYFLKLSFFRASSIGFPTFKTIDKSLWLTDIKLSGFSFDTAVFIAIIAFGFLFVYFKHFKHGYEINVVGDSPSTARYAGMKVGRITVRTMFLSSALVGLAGVLQLTGASSSHSLSVNMTGGVGWTAIIVAWLARLNPIAILIVSVLMAMLDKGTSVARSKMGISDAAADILQGIILFSVLAGDFFIRYKVNLKRNDEPIKTIKEKTDGKEYAESVDEKTDGKEYAESADEKNNGKEYAESAAVKTDGKKHAESAAVKTDGKEYAESAVVKTDVEYARNAVSEAVNAVNKENAVDGGQA
ncbi:MAG: ABC transporter permease [Clostridiales bacterium]|nr:ABC transporter permease [Clostridiales bacterium]